MIVPFLSGIERSWPIGGSVSVLELTKLAVSERDTYAQIGDFVRKARVSCLEPQIWKFSPKITKKSLQVGIEAQVLRGLARKTTKTQSSNNTIMKPHCNLIFVIWGIRKYGKTLPSL